MEPRGCAGLDPYIHIDNRWKTRCCSTRGRATCRHPMMTRGQTILVMCIELVVYCLVEPHGRTKMVPHGRAESFHTGALEIHSSAWSGPGSVLRPGCPPHGRGISMLLSFPKDGLVGVWAQLAHWTIINISAHYNFKIKIVFPSKQLKIIFFNEPNFRGVTHVSGNLVLNWEKDTE